MVGVAVAVQAASEGAAAVAGMLCMPHTCTKYCNHAACRRRHTAQSPCHRSALECNYSMLLAERIVR